VCLGLWDFCGNALMSEINLRIVMTFFTVAACKTLSTCTRGKKKQKKGIWVFLKGVYYIMHTHVHTQSVVKSLELKYRGNVHKKYVRCLSRVFICAKRERELSVHTHTRQEFIYPVARFPLLIFIWALTNVMHEWFLCI
jgi:hypothetical protein